MERAAKLRRLNDIRRLKAHCSASALSQILSDVKEHGIPDLIGRREIRQARDLIVSSDTAYGPILKSIACVLPNGAIKHIPVACPFASLVKGLGESAGFRRFFKWRLQAKGHPTPEAPWNIVIYSDEITPGNVVAPLNRRKFQSIYWTILELGIEALSHEESWFILMTEFSQVVNSLNGGMSQCFASAVKCFFDPEGFHMLDSGILVDLGDEQVRLFLKIGLVLQDGGAQKAVWGARGDGASKFCLLCKNLFTHESAMTADDGSHLLRCNVIKLDELEASTDTELRNNARYLDQEFNNLGAGAFNRLQQAMGLTHTPCGILLDRSLDRLLSPSESFVHDPMHALFVDGVVNLVVYLCFEAHIQSGAVGIYESFSEFLSHWCFPARLNATHLSDIFASDRRDKHRDAKHIKCQASDMLSVLGPLSIFVRSVLLPRGTCNAACNAMSSLISLVDLVGATARVEVLPARLLGAVHCFLEHFVEAFGYECLIPKAHWLLHFADTLEKFEVLPNCFVLERKHRLPKRYATDLHNISGNASRSLLSECVCQHLSTLRACSFEFRISLLQPRRASLKTRREIHQILELDDNGRVVMVSSVARFSPVAICNRKDVVLLRDGGGFTAGRVHVHVNIADIVLSLVQPFRFQRRSPGSSLAIWEVPHSPVECWETSDILASVEYIVYPDASVGTILPLEYR